MLLLTVFYSIPEFDISSFFLMSCSAEKLNGIGNVSMLRSNSSAAAAESRNSSSAAGASGPEADPERIRLKTPGSGGPKYTQQVNQATELEVCTY